MHRPHRRAVRAGRHHRGRHHRDGHENLPSRHPAGLRHPRHGSYRHPHRSDRRRERPADPHRVGVRQYVVDGVPLPQLHLRDAATCCLAKRSGGVPADEGWAGLQIAPTKTGCYQRAGDDPLA